MGQRTTPEDRSQLRTIGMWTQTFAATDKAKR